VTFYVDNVKVSADSAHAIDAKNITSVRVMKGSKLASGNQMWITVRDSVDRVRTIDTPVKQKQPFTGLVMIDGVASDISAMKAIDPSRIATVDIIKGTAAMEQYSDPRAKDGVIVILLKH
jgi:hypothetical protein